MSNFEFHPVRRARTLDDRVSRFGPRVFAALRVCFAIVLIALMSVTTRAQSVWEVTPYKTTVWVALGSQPDIPAGWLKELPEHIEGRLGAIFRAAIDNQVVPAPDTIRPKILHGIGRLEAHDVLADDASQSLDKLVLVAVDSVGGRYRLRTRQLDCRTHVWSRLITAQVPLANSVTPQICQAIADGFQPLTAIDRAEAEKVTALLRAGTLIRDAESPALLGDDAVLRPVLRRTSHSGSPSSDLPRPVPWTYLTVKSRTGSKLDCLLESAFAQPFRTRRSRSVQRLAILVRPSDEATTLRLESRDQPGVPLVDYEIYKRAPSSNAVELLGRTDWRGRLQVPTGREVQRLLVKHGDRLLARLPIVSGAEPEVVAALTDDRRQLAAEGFLAGAEANLVEMVARRETLTANIRGRIRRGELDQAQKLLEKLRGLPSEDEFRRQLERRQQTMSATDDVLRRKIDTMFAETYQLLGKYLSPRRAQELQDELAAARASISE